MYMIYCDMFPARLLKDLYVHVVSNSAPEGTDHWQLLEAVAGGGGGGVFCCYSSKDLHTILINLY